MLSKLICGRSCHFLLNSFLSNDPTSILSFRRHCDVALFDPSSCFVKIMFNSFHLQSECCPNYIILIPSLSCFNRSVISIIPLLTGVSSKCFHFAKFILLPSISNRSVVVIDLYRSLYISFLPECLHVLLVHCNPFLMSFNLQGSSNVPCSSFLT